MKRTVIAVALLAMAAISPAMASDEAIATRQAVMKDNGAAIGALAKMVKGEAEYDALAAQLAMRTIHSAAVGFDSLFPAGSETGGDTAASPKIWEDMEGFRMAAAKMAEDASAAIGPAGQGLDSLKGAFGAVAKNCGSCHDAYRVKKN
ncbi:MAG: cytochrome c [Rhodobiaceae bacterium]|nr:cytochrome c [Rhodobiaceae bacterium]MCC0054710.1 cytochrome c [Rhodobiaceae bacterium]